MPALAELYDRLGFGPFLRRQGERLAQLTAGCINECYYWPGDAGAMFVKVAAPEAHAMFAAEAAGLAELEWAHAVRVPRVLASGHTERCAFLALEWIEVGVAGPDCE